MKLNCEGYNAGVCCFFGKNAPKYRCFTLFPADIPSFPPKNTGCRLLQVWHVMNCHHKHHWGYKYLHLCTEKEADALVLLWPLRDTTPGNGWRQHLRLAFDLQECVFGLSPGWTQIYTPPGTAMMRFIQHNSICTPGSGGEPAQSFVHLDPAGTCWRRRVSHTEQ